MNAKFLFSFLVQLILRRVPCLVSLSVSVCLFFCLSFCPYLLLSVYLSSSVYLSVCLSICMSICLSISLTPIISCRFFKSVTLLWNLLENGDASEVAEQLSNEESISQLREAFVHQLLQVELFSSIGRFKD